LQEKKLLRTSTESLSRLAREKAEVSKSVDPSHVTRKVEALTKPKSMGGTMKKAGIALLATPDPFTGVPGAALLASSFVLKKKEPASLANLAAETRKVLRDLGSLSV
jgi:hypothetical protein